MINRFIYQIIGQSTRAEITRLLDAMQINGPPTGLDDSEREIKHYWFEWAVAFGTAKS